MRLLILTLVFGANTSALLSADDKTKECKLDPVITGSGTDLCRRLAGGDDKNAKLASKILNKGHSEWETWSPSLVNCTKEKLDKAPECNQKCADRLKEIEKCAAAFAIMSYRGLDYISEYADLNNVKQSFDGKIRCNADGYQTQDFPTCVDMVNAYDASFLTEGVIVQGQQMQFQHEMIQSQSKNMGAPGAAVTGALNVQKDSLATQAEQARVQAGLQATKMGLFIKYYNDMPNITTLREHCKSNFKLRANDEYKYTAHSDTAALCDSLITGDSSQFTFLKNVKAMDAAKLIAMKAGVDASLLTYKGSLLDSQADKVQGAINAVEGFSPVDFSSAQTDLMLEKCQANPSDPACLNTANSSQGFTGLSVNFGGGGNTSVTQATPTQSDAALTAAGGVIDDPGSTIEGASLGASADKGPSGIVGGIVSGAASQAPGQAQGGGGLALGGAAPPGGSSGGGGDGTAPQGATAATGSKVAYEEGRLSASGGAGLAAKSAAKGSGENPFASLLGKNGEKIQGKELNFRGPASDEYGAEGKNIFQRISDGYVRARSSNKLLIYEAQAK